MHNSCVNTANKLMVSVCKDLLSYAHYPQFFINQSYITELYSFCTPNMFRDLHKSFINFLSVILEFYAKSTNSTKTIILLSK